TQRRHEEHRRPDATERSEYQELPIGLSECARARRQCHDQDARDVNAPLPQPLHQYPADRRATQPHRSERTDDERRGTDAHPEVARILRQHRRHHAIPQRDHRIGGDQYPDFARQRGFGGPLFVLRQGTHAKAFATTSRAASCTCCKCSGPRNDSAYILYTSSVPDGRAANHASAVVTFSPPSGAPLPGAVVNFAVIFSPASSVARTSSADNFASRAFCSRSAGASNRAYVGAPYFSVSSSY